MTDTPEVRRARAILRVAGRRDQSVGATPTPLEIIARCVVGEISHDDMMKDLRGREYTAGHIPAGSYDGWVRGTWAEVEIAHTTGLLTDCDLQALLPLAPGHRDSATFVRGSDRVAAALADPARRARVAAIRAEMATEDARGHH